MPTLTVYDPPMCCSSGVCGPEVDPTLVRFASDLAWLAERGVRVERVNLAQEPARFAANAVVRQILDRSGTDELPAIVMGDRLVAVGRYPGRDELAAWAGVGGGREAADLDERVRELIALGAAIGAGCEPCLAFHTDRARNLGVTVAEMREAVRIGEAVKAASARHMAGLAERTLGALEPDRASGTCCGGDRSPRQRPSTGCC